MAAEIPTSEPTSIRAGDTWSWSRSLSDYPASSGWQLTYTLINAASKITIAATASGADHLVSVAATTTAGYAPGLYAVTARVSLAGVSASWTLPDIEVLPNLAAQTTYDARSFARRMLDLIEAALEGRATAQQLDTLETGVGDRTLRREPEKLRAWHDHYSAKVKAESRAALIATGRDPGNRVEFRL